MRTALGIDIGTTAVKTILISSDGSILAQASASHDLISEHIGWAEEDALVWWENVKICLGTLKNDDPAAFSRIAAVSVSGMVPALVLLDENGSPVRKTIQQNDTRSTREIEELTLAMDPDLLFARTGSRMNQQHVLPRLLWVKRHEPEVFAKVCTVLGSYDYIAYRLTGVFSLESNFAAESGLFDIRTKELIREYLTAYDIPESLFPKVNEPLCVIGSTNGSDGFLPAGIPVLAGTADHVASTLAAGILENGDMLIKFGGAGDILYCTDCLLTDRRLYFDYHLIPGKYLLNGCMASSGSLVKWFTKDILSLEGPDVLRMLDTEAASVPPASDGLLVLPYFLGEKTPVFDPDARGVFYGLTLSHTRAHLYRAVLESVIYGFRDHVAVLADMGLHPAHVIASDGGAKSRVWCQIASDVLNVPVTAYTTHPGSALGAAFLAGMSAGLFRDFREIRKFLTEPRYFTPDPEAAKIYDKAFPMYRELYHQLKPLNEKETHLYE